MQLQFNELTDAQWLLISPFLPLNRKRRHDLRSVINAILYVNRTGIQWRNLYIAGSVFPYWQIIYYYFRKWTKLRIFDKINFELVKFERERQLRTPEPSANIIDSQSIKIAPFIPDDKGIDGNKKINGRKRHIITDTLGLILGTAVTGADIHDGVGGCTLFNRSVHKLSKIECIFADAAYGGKFRESVEDKGIKLEIAAKPESAKGFIPVKKRWVVERTFGWLNFFRRLAKDYERKVESSESMIYLAQIQVLLNRLDTKTK